MNKLILLLTLIALNVSGQSSHFERVSEELKEASGDYVLVIAHRGDWRNAPENSLQAVQNCIDMGVDIVEMDVRITFDRQVVVTHDKYLDRTTNGRGKVSHQSLDSLKKLSLLNGYGLPTHHKIPSLAEVLRLAKGRIHVFIDKAYYILPEVWEIVEKTGTQNQVLFEGKATYEEFREKYPDLINKINYMPRIKPEMADLQTYVNQYISKAKVPLLITSFEKENVNFFNQIKDFRKIPVGIMGATLWDKSCAGHTDDLSVTKPEEGWGWMIAQGFTAICTDRPAMLIKYLNQRKLHIK